jgi:hypothetical protein
MKIESASYQNGCLILTTSDPEARRFAYEFEVGEYTVKKAKKRRSLDSNAYAWTLIDKIAAAVKLPKEEVYRNTIRRIGGVSDIVCVKNEAVANLRRSWTRNGIGWQVETMPSKIEGCTNVILYYGSSSYDQKQMSVFLEKLIEDARSLGIETLPPYRLEGLLNEWS